MIRDFKLALRQLLKSPGYTALAVVALALGIGANTAIFSAVDGLFLRPLGFARPDRLVRVANSMKDRGLREVAISYPRYLSLRAGQRAFTDILVTANTAVTLTGRGDPAPLIAVRVSANFTDVLGLHPFIGRAFTAAEDREGGPAVAMLSCAYWRQTFAGDPSVVGRSLTLNGVPTTVVGIMPAAMDTPYDQTQVFLPRVFDEEGLPREVIDKGSGYLFAIGRLRDGVTLAQADEDLNVLSARYRRDDPTKVDAAGSLFCVPLQEDLVGNQRPMFLVLVATVGFVLVIACANVANLLLARFSRRRKEVAIRTALGATRGRLVRQFLAESVLTSLIAGALGLLIAEWGIDILEHVANAANNAIPRLQSVALDPTVLAFAIGVALASGIVLGVVPALHASRSDASEALKESVRGSTGGHSVGRMRSVLLITEVALSLVLLVGAALLLDSFRLLQRVDAGFDPRGAVLFDVTLPPGTYATPGRQAQFYREVMDKLRALPGVAAVSGIDNVPLSGNDTYAPYAVEGRPIPEMKARPLALRPSAAPGYFQTLGVPLLAGRDFTWRDGADAPQVVIISQAMARRMFPHENPLGRRLITGILSTPREIVGVAGDVRSLGLGQDAPDQMYYPTAQAGAFFFNLILRTPRPAGSLRAEITAAVHAVDSNLPVSDLEPLTDVVSQAVAGRQLAMDLLSGFAGLSLLLAGMGIYTVIAYVVTQRTAEIGIRMALGAAPRAVFLMVMRQGMALALTGLVIGLAAALALGRLVSGLLYQVSAYDPWILTGVSAFLALVAALACAVPAWRAVRIDPIAALREP
jgi:putative ABC transport system permease protein